MSEPVPGKVPTFALTLMLVFFVLSGASGLIYQAVWSQYLGMILGHAAYAQSLVLATFMGGMAFGAWLASRYLERLGSLLRSYGLLEGAIGIFGIVFHGLFLMVSAWLFDRWIPSLGSVAAVDASRYVVALLLILPQTILLGMTFPVMSAGLIRWMPGTAGRILGGLYFFNSIGAAAGALLATFVLVPRAGLPGAMVFAGILNLLIAMLVVMLRVPIQPPSQTTPAVRSAADTRLLAFVLTAAFVTGWASFMYEIGWVRMLSLALGSSLHSFEMMLAAFIGGLAFGGLYIRRHLDSTTSPMRFLGWIQICMGIAALATLPLYDFTFDAVGWVITNINRTEGGYVLYNLVAAVISISIMAPAAFFAGMTLPLMTFALLRNGGGEKAIGQVYAANTLGAILGVMLMVHWAMPTLGLKLSMVLAASIDIVLGLVILRWRAERVRRFEFVGATVLCLAVVVVVMQLSQFDPRKLASGVYRSGVSSIQAGSEILFLRDGKTASVGLYGQPNETLTIVTNGKPDASVRVDPSKLPTQDEPTMVLAALLGLAYHHDPKRVAVIGFGSGLTTHALATSSQPAEITTVEIEPIMVEAARGFGAAVERAFNDPRSKIVYDDARAFFSGQARTFDVIVSEPSNPWVSGVAKLFSQEFYEFVPRHLAKDGVLVQWVQAYEMSDGTLLSILGALDNKFADYVIYTSNDWDLLIVASPVQPLPPLNAAMFSEPATAAIAARFGITTIADISIRKIADRRVVRAMLEAEPPILNSDYFPVVAHKAPRDRFMNLSAAAVSAIGTAPASALNLLGVRDPETSVSNLNPPTWNMLVAGRRRGLAVVDSLNGLPEGDVLDSIYPRDRSDVALLREWSAGCFQRADVQRTIRIVTHLFRISTAQLTMAEAARAWKQPSWVVCAAGSAPPQEISWALHSLELGLDPSAGVELLEQATRVFAEVRGLPAETLVDYYALALVGAARARLPEEVQALRAAIHGGLPLSPAGRLQMRTIGVLALEVALAVPPPDASAPH